MYETNYYRAGEEAREADDLFSRIPKGSRLIEYILHYGKHRTFDELAALVSRWCQGQAYRVKESPVVDISALPAGVEEDDAQVGNLNAARMARQPLQGRGRGGAKRPPGRAPAGRSASAPVKPPHCANCGGHHRIRICPKTLSDKDPEYQKRKAAGTLPYDKCDYKDPKGCFHLWW